MRRSTTRILTTHTGSLPRPAKVVELLLAEKDGRRRTAPRSMPPCAMPSPTWCRSRSPPASTSINDGEQGRTDYTVHVIDRLTGFEGRVHAAARHRRAGISRAGGPAQPVRLAVPASPGVLGAGGVEGFCRRRGRHRALQGCDGGGRRRGIFHDLAVARPDRALPEEPPLQDRRGISLTRSPT